MQPVIKKISLPFLYVFIVLLSVFAVPRQASAVEVIKIGGVGSALGTMKLLASAFEKRHPGTKVEVLSSIGTKGALKAVPEGGVDIGLAGRMLTDEESLGLSVIEYARTPFIFVTRKEMKEEGLTTEEIVKIYMEKKDTWSGGERIRWILHPPDDPDSLIVKSLSPEVEKALDNALSRRGILIALTDQENLDLIEKTPGAMGYTTLTQIISEKRPVKALSLNGVLPSVKTLKDGSYPICKPLIMVTKKGASGKVKKFIDFVMSKAGAGILKNTGNMTDVDKVPRRKCCFQKK